MNVRNPDKRGYWSCSEADYKILTKNNIRDTAYSYISKLNPPKVCPSTCIIEGVTTSTEMAVTVIHRLPQIRRSRNPDKSG
jgi:hypothetical protein